MIGISWQNARHRLVETLLSPLAHAMGEKELVSFCERGNNRSLSMSAAGVEETALEQPEKQQDVQYLV